MDQKALELLVAIAPPIGAKIKEYFAGKKRINSGTVQILLLAQVLEQSKQVNKILENHIQHEEGVMKELLETIRAVRGDLVKAGLIK